MEEQTPEIASDLRDIVDSFWLIAGVADRRKPQPNPLPSEPQPVPTEKEAEKVVERTEAIDRRTQGKYHDTLINTLANFRTGFYKTASRRLGHLIEQLIDDQEVVGIDTEIVSLLRSLHAELEILSAG